MAMESVFFKGRLSRHCFVLELDICWKGRYATFGRVTIFLPQKKGSHGAEAPTMVEANTLFEEQITW